MLLGTLGASLLGYMLFAKGKKVIRVGERTVRAGYRSKGYFCIGIINFMFNGNSLTSFTTLFSPNDFKRNYDII